MHADCRPRAELRDGMCCGRGERWGTISGNPDEWTCCSVARGWCNGVCCDIGESCEDGTCSPIGPCVPVGTHIYYGATVSAMTREAEEHMLCTLQFVGCGDIVERRTTINYLAGERCPGFDRDHRVNDFGDRSGREVCCEDLQRCVADPSCDPLSLGQERSQPAPKPGFLRP
jgi:hypothetical protein